MHECRSEDVDMGLQPTVAECAARTSAIGAPFFIYGTNEYRIERCDEVDVDGERRCRCYAEVTLACNMVESPGFNLWENTGACPPPCPKVAYLSRFWSGKGQT